MQRDKDFFLHKNYPLYINLHLKARSDRNVACQCRIHGITEILLHVKLHFTAKEISTFCLR